MKPVLIQYLHKKNKGKYQATPTTKEETEHYNKAASFVFWCVIGLVVVGLLIA